MLTVFRALAVSWAVARYGKSHLLSEAAEGAAAAIRKTADGNFFSAFSSYGAVHAVTDGYGISGNATVAVTNSISAFIQESEEARETGALANAAAIADAEVVGQASPELLSALCLSLASSALWPREPPPVVQKAWADLKDALLTAEDYWEVWVNWYENRLYGRVSIGEGFDLAVATLPDELWEAGPAAVNARIKELIAEHTPPEPIPAQGAGPHFALSPDLKIALAPPGEIDAAGNNMARIGNLLPVVRQVAGDLAGHLNPNTQPEISRIVGDYRAAIAGEPERIAWGSVFGIGVRLENAAAASRREIADRLCDPLEDAPQEALDSLLALHGPLMLATAEGREFADDADRFSQTREQQAELRRDAQFITENLKDSPEIIEAPAARLGEEAAASIGEGPHPERGTVFGLATVKHAATIFIPAATLAGFVPAGAAAAGLLGAAVGGGIAWAGYETLKRSKMYSTATAALGPVWDQLLQGGEAQALRVLVRLAPFRTFVARNEELLRRIAENTTQLRWTLRYIDFILRTNSSRND